MRPEGEDRGMLRSLLPAALLPALAACHSLDFRLDGVPFPVSASPAGSFAGKVEPFEVKARSVLWVHGLLGQTRPDVAALVREAGGDCQAMVDFRVTAGASVHDWIITHLTLGLVRSKSVTITGKRLLK